MTPPAVQEWLSDLQGPDVATRGWRKRSERCCPPRATCRRAGVGPCAPCGTETCSRSCPRATCWPSWVFSGSSTSTLSASISPWRSLLWLTKRPIRPHIWYALVVVYLGYVCTYAQTSFNIVSLVFLCSNIAGRATSKVSSYIYSTL